VEDLGTSRDGGRVGSVDVLAGLDREGKVVQSGRVEEEGLLFERLPQPQRARPGSGEAQVVDLLAALALDEERLGQAEQSEDVGVEVEGAIEIAADEVDVTEPDEH
jgi:hypothetical protein